MKQLSLLILACILLGCSEDAVDIEGHYLYTNTEANTKNTLNIHEVVEDHFFFEIHSAADQYVGYLEGTARLTSDSTADLVETEYGPCELTFTLRENGTVEINETKGTCNLGIGASYLGKYKRVSNHTQEMPFY